MRTLGYEPSNGALKPMSLRDRKDSHLDLVLNGKGAAAGVSTGFEQVRFEHCALPELDLDDIDVGLDWLGRRLLAPFLISSMTGGALRAEQINRNLAQAAEELGIAFAVGSQRVALEGEGRAGLTSEIRRLAPSVPLLSNLGAAQLVGRDGLAMAERAVEQLGADALIIHLNPLQEALQSGGDRNWRGVLGAIARLSAWIHVPIVVKEVGAGISATTARRLAEVGVAAIDVAGAGGTSWAAIEAERAVSETERRIATGFGSWGIPTAQAIATCRRALPSMFIIGSGGVRDGIDAGKAIRLGADLVGQAAGVLGNALQSVEAVVETYRVQIGQLRTVCFCTGSADLDALRLAPLVGGEAMLGAPA